MDPHPCLSHKDFFYSNAVKLNENERRGRPSGGLELYIDPSLCAKIISKSPSYLCAETKTLYIIGVYFKPLADLDDIISDIHTAIVSCNNFNKGIVIGGDFNLHYGTNNFSNLASFLASYDILLVSDPSIITFVGNRGSSTPDHVFCSTHLKISSVSVPQRTESDHFPITVSILNSTVSRYIPTARKRINIEKCKMSMSALRDSCETQSPDAIAEKLQHILTQCQELVPLQNHRSKLIEKLKAETKDALSMYMKFRSQFFRSYYLSCRRNLHSEIAKHKRQKLENKLTELFRRTDVVGIRALYNQARPKSLPLSPHVPLHEWRSFFSKLYQTHCEPQFTEIPVVPTLSGSKLDYPFTVTEILTAIHHQRSSAKGVNGVSPANLKPLADDLAPLLSIVFNGFLENPGKFPESWLSTIFFLIHKKGTFTDPSNYRSLAIEDPLLKIFSTCLYNRISDYAESNKLLPDFQFGFRRNYSSCSAASLLRHSIEVSLKKKKRVYACFVDFKKAFDLVDRNLLCQKLQLMGFPSSIVKLIFTLLQGLQLYIRSNNSLSDPFQSFNGVPQGDPLSPLLFSLFIADLPNSLTHCGIQTDSSVQVNHILYADDLVILSHNPEQLQRAINRLSIYCNKNKITVSVEKSKCMIFHNGYHAPISFTFQNQPLETVNQFTYLGIVFTTRLSSSKHVLHIISKCQAKIGLLYSQLPLQKIPISVCVDVFNTYILPVMSYGLACWFPNITNTSCSKLNAVFTKYLKLCLGLPYNTNNAITYLLTNQLPVCETLKSLWRKSFYKLVFPEVLSGLYLNPPVDNPEEGTYSPVEHIPSYFWLSPVIDGPLPNLPEPRRALLYDLIDIHHSHLCTREDFHLLPEDSCLCKFCRQSANYSYHYRDCPMLKCLSPCGRYRKIFSKHVLVN